MSVYVCENCNYRFNSDIEEERKKCPYCNKREAFHERSAEDLIGEEF